jgi:hypothetical protein
MMRLSGLPHIGRYPEATVKRMEEQIEVHFGGRGEEQVVNVPLKYVGTEDGESTELRLMAQLQEMGYKVRRAE